MRGDARVIELLNGYLQIELCGYKQYLVAAAAAENWGYDRLRDRQREYVKEEMEHAGRILHRILYLEGTPVPSDAGEIVVASSIEDPLRRDEALVRRAIVHLRGAIDHCTEQGDAGTRELLEEMLVDEEHHLDWLEIQLRLVASLGLDGYLQEQMHG
ncbi:bacterioferritin [Myxococcaceae bacterium]|nr:bacterioferritin [Myxococcaceae bacterium]